jgi:putative toxin-antitoxin system antitoxin component (TIGR02293 family)
MDIDTIKLLGGSKLLGKFDSLTALAQKGLPKQSLVFFLKQSQLDEKRVFLYLDVTKRTLDNYQPKERMRLYISDRLIHLAELFAKGKELFNSLDGFTEWLHSPSIDLEGEKPIDQIHTRKGVEDLLTILGRLEHGILA